MLRPITLLITLVLSISASAQDFNYTFLQGGYNLLDLDGVDGDGFGVSASLAVTDNFHVFAGYDTLEMDDFDADIDLTDVGIGYNTGIFDGVDFVATLSWVNTEASIDGFGSADADGYRAGFGIRAWLVEGIELDMGIDYSEYDSASGESSLNLGLLYRVTENFSLVLTGDWDDSFDVGRYAISARYAFGN